MIQSAYRYAAFIKLGIAAAAPICQIFSRLQTPVSRIRVCNFFVMFNSANYVISASLAAVPCLARDEPIESRHQPQSAPQPREYWSLSLFGAFRDCASALGLARNMNSEGVDAKPRKGLSRK